MAKQYDANPFDVINAAFHGMAESIVAGRVSAEVSKVIFNDPATIVYWADGLKTVVRCQDGDAYDARTGFLMCCAKRLFGNTGRYNDVIESAVAGSDGAEE